MTATARFLGAMLLAVRCRISPRPRTRPPEEARRRARGHRSAARRLSPRRRRRAFSLATPGIRATFGDAETFMNMVRRSYAVVYRPTAWPYTRRSSSTASWCSPCGLPTPKAAHWLRSTDAAPADGSWRTNGCVLERFRRDADLIRYHLFVDPCESKPRFDRLSQRPPRERRSTVTRAEPSLLHRTAWSSGAGRSRRSRKESSPDERATISVTNALSSGLGWESPHAVGARVDASARLAREHVQSDGRYRIPSDIVTRRLRRFSPSAHQG